MNKTISEEATGIRPSLIGLGCFYDVRENRLSREEAQDVLHQGETVEVPNAGAGSYKEFFLTRMGYDSLKAIDQTSSAGDWSFGVAEEGVWYLAFQDNRWPYSGFRYTVNYQMPAITFEVLCSYTEM